MADLITAAELATWTGNVESEVAVDPLAIEVMEKVSGLARFLGGHEEWELAPVNITDKVPYDVRLVVLMVAKRCYENPAQVVQEGGIGPIGGDRVLDVAALLLSLTESERATLTKYNADGDPDSNNSVFVLRGTVRPETQIDAVLYVPDDSFSDWYIPMFSPGDPGDPNLYPDEG
jgi:hypothetical protein